MKYYLELADDRIKYVGDILSQRGEEVCDIEDKMCCEGAVVILSPAHKMSIDEVKKYAGAKIVFGGKQADNVSESFSEGQYVNVLFYEDFVIRNSKFTAENFLVPLISSTKFSLYDEKILITGSGRLSHALWHLLDRLCVPFAATMRDEKILSNVRLFAAEAFPLDEMGDKAKEYSVVINTIPSVIFDKTEFSKGCTFFELSSVKSIGENMGVRYIACPALPGKYSPKSAGKALLEIVDSHIKNT